MSKLKVYSIKGSTFNLFQPYLINHTQKYVVNGSISKSKPLGFGTPQGTTLDPHLFMLHINKLPSCLENSEPHVNAVNKYLTFAGKGPFKRIKHVAKTSNIVGWCWMVFDNVGLCCMLECSNASNNAGFRNKDPWF